MRSLIVPTILVGCMFPIIAGAMTAASSIIESQEAHKSGTESGPLWTVDPVHIDKLAQNYERLPASLAYVPPSPSPTATNLVAEIPSSAPERSVEQAANSEAIAWCGARYRSYNETDNTYQPLAGGPRRQCSPPALFSQQVAQALQGNPVVANDDHAQRCASKYSSYRSSDDSYQPFTGTRRRCLIDGRRGEPDDLQAAM